MDYQEINKKFCEWLQTLNYSPKTIYTSHNFIKDFFVNMEGQNINQIQNIDAEATNNYVKQLLLRKNKRREGSLSPSTIIGHINAIKRLNRLLQLMNQQCIPIEMPNLEAGIKHIAVLTRKEIQAIYQSCDGSPTGIRDKAMLSLYYGCGLRRNEGISLNTKDILLKENLVFVKHSKTYRQRYVPITANIRADIEEYISIRNRLAKDNTMAFLLNYRGTRITGQSLYERLKLLLKAANINKAAGLHTLRHSIATHLLQGGMQLEDISRFLGHSSLESTQIYTHLKHEEI